MAFEEEPLVQGPSLKTAVNPNQETGIGKTGLNAASAVAPGQHLTGRRLQGSHSTGHRRRDKMDQLEGLLLTTAWRS